MDGCGRLVPLPFVVVVDADEPLDASLEEAKSRPIQFGMDFGRVVLSASGLLLSFIMHCTRTSFFQASIAILHVTSAGILRQVQKHR